MSIQNTTIEAARWAPPGQGVVDFSLVIACYCEEPHLFQNIMEVCEYLGASRFCFELIFVEDCSPDGTRKEVMRCHEALVRMGVANSVYLHSTNQGRGRTVQDGFEKSAGEFVGFIDIDLEHPVDALLPMLLQLRRNDCDAVVARRIYAGMATPHRTVMSLAYKALVHLFIDLPVSDTEAGCKVFRREKLLPVLEGVTDHGWFWDTEIVHQSYVHGLKFGEHPIAFEKNPAKKSTVHIVRDSLRYLKCLYIYWRALKRAGLTRSHIRKSN